MTKARASDKQNRPASLVVEDGVLAIRGMIHFDTVMALYQQGQALIMQMDKVIIELLDLEHCDSSGLALCTAWMRTAKLQNKSIEFTNVPLFMQDLIRVYGLDSVLPIKVKV